MQVEANSLAVLVDHKHRVEIHGLAIESLLEAKQQPLLAIVGFKEKTQKLVGLKNPTDSGV